MRIVHGYNPGYDVSVSNVVLFVVKWKFKNEYTNILYNFIKSVPHPIHNIHINCDIDIFSFNAEN